MIAQEVEIGMAEGFETATSIVVQPPLEPAKRTTSRMALRTATFYIHQRLHQHPGLARLAAGTIRRDEYRRLLGRSYGFYAMAEPVVGLSRELTDCLAMDLTDLGMTYAAVSKLPRCPQLEIGDGHVERIGGRYVLLGASLGGKVMAKALARRGAVLPVRFLDRLGENEWAEFVADLEVNLSDTASATRAAEAATATFAAYEDWMAGYE